MRYLLVTLTFLLFFTGCQDKGQSDQEEQSKHDAQIAQQARAELLAELEAKKRQDKELQKQKLTDKKNSKLNQIGIHMEQDSITIDTNKTKEFLNDLNKKMNIQMQKISDDLRKGIIETKDAGVEVNEEYIHIDLNKTQNMFQDWGEKIQIFVQEFNEIVNNIENNDTKEKE